MELYFFLSQEEIRVGSVLKRRRKKYIGIYFHHSRSDGAEKKESVKRFIKSFQFESIVNSHYNKE